MAATRVAGLLDLPQPEDQIEEWQRAWDEIEDMHLEDEGESVDDDAAFRRKRPDAWAVSWDKRYLLILEFTRPNDPLRTDGQMTRFGLKCPLPPRH